MRIRVRQELERFASIMEERLAANDYKGGWEDCEIDWLFDRLQEEIRELKDECFRENSCPRGTNLVTIMHRKGDYGLDVFTIIADDWFTAFLKFREFNPGAGLVNVQPITQKQAAELEQ